MDGALSAAPRDLKIRYDVVSCTHTRELRRILTHRIPVLEQGAHQGCMANELVSLVERHYPKELPVDGGALKEARTFTHSVWCELGKPKVRPLEASEVLALKRGNTLKRFRAALERDRWAARDGRVGAFVKFEKVSLDKLEKPARLIQYRDPVLTLELSKWLTPIEHALWEYRPDWNNGLRCFAKGRSPKQRAADLVALDDMPGLYYDVDHSKFDSRIGEPLLRLSHDFYAMFSSDWEFKRMLSLLRRVKGRTAGGIKYTGTPRRCSGDPDTALGNSIINLAVLHTVLSALGVPFRIYLDGDDAVVKVCSYTDHSDQIRGGCLRFGLETKVEVRQSLEYVTFCQASIVPTLKGHVMMREWQRAVSRMSYVINWPAKPFDYIASVGLGELHSSAGCPILYPLARAMACCGGKVSPEYFEWRHLIALKDRAFPPDDVSLGHGLHHLGIPPGWGSDVGRVLLLQGCDTRNGAAAWSRRSEAFRKRT